MAALVVPNAALLTLRWGSASGTWRNVVGVGGNPSLPVIDQALANALFTAISTNTGFVQLLSLLAPEAIFEAIGIRDIHAPNLPEFVSTGTPVGGGGTGDMLPLSVAAVASLRTALAGKRFRGRIYYSGWSELQNDTNGRMSAAVGPAVVAGTQGINSSLAAHSMILAVVGRPRDAKTIPAVTRPALSGIMTPATATISRDQRWDSQRRRTGRS